jgi:hypothetical protein
MILEIIWFIIAIVLLILIVTKRIPPDKVTYYLAIFNIALILSTNFFWRGISLTTMRWNLIIVLLWLIAILIQKRKQ